MVTVHTIKLTRAEGTVIKCQYPVYEKTFEDATKVLVDWSKTAPLSQFGHHKVDFVIYFSDGYDYVGTYPLTQDGFHSLKEYCKSNIGWARFNQSNEILDTYFN